MEIISNIKTGPNTLEVEFKISPEEFEAGVQDAFLKSRNKITIAGFRKGKAPRKMIERQYGENVFYEDAIDILYPKYLTEVTENLALEIVDRPKPEILSISKEDGVTVKVVFTTSPEVNIKDYLGLKIENIESEVTDEAVDERIREVQLRNARLVDVSGRPVKSGDEVDLSFAGFKNGEPFENNSSESYQLKIGSGTFIPGFEDQVVGHDIGEDFDVNVTFPENYPKEDLAGQPVVFKCKVHSIKEQALDQLDDEFAKDVSEFDTFEEYRADVKEKLREDFEYNRKNKIDNEISKRLSEKLEGDIPEIMYRNRTDDLVSEWDFNSKEKAGIGVEEYLKMANIGFDKFSESFRDTAKIEVNMRLALIKIAELENIQITTEEIEQKYLEISEDVKLDIEKVKIIISEKKLKEDILREKAFNLVRENATY